MARTKISEFSATPGNNTDIDGINIAEGCAPSGINDAIRELMSQLKDFQAGTAGDSFNGPVGTTTAAAGAFTTLSASSTVSGTGFSNYLASPPAIGGTAAAAGSFTTLSASSTVTLSGGTANGVLYLNGSKVATSGSGLTFDGTNFGVGTTTPSYAVDIRNAASTALRVGSNGNSFGSLLSWDNPTGTGRLWTLGSYDFVFGVNSSEQMRLTSTGLGVGTSSPTTKLDVNGDARIGGTSVSQSLLTVGGGSTSAAVNLRGATGSAYAWQISSNAFVGSALEFTRSTAVGGTTFSTPSMLLDSSGNLGLGVTPSGYLANKFVINTGTDSNNGITIASATNRNGSIWFADGTTGDQAYRGGVDYQHTTDTLYLYSGGQGNFQLTAAGNLGLGVTPSAWRSGAKAFQSGTTGYVSLNEQASGALSLNWNCYESAANTWTYYVTGFAPSRYTQLSGAHAWYTAASGTAGNAISFTQAATLTADGDYLVGQTSAGLTDANSITLSKQYGVVYVNHLTGQASGAQYAIFGYAGGSIGSITQNGTTAVAYNTSSDYRLKDNPQPLTGSGAFIDALQPKTWNWKADGSKGVGFIAHEVQEVSPGSVVGEKDGEQMQAMEYGSAEFIANIIAELQSLRKRVAQLEKGN